MKILTLNYEYPPVGGGGGVASKQMAEAFVAAGHDVDVVTSSLPELPAREEVSGVTVYRRPVGRRNRATASIHSMLAYPPSGLSKAVGLCRRRDYDLIHSHFAVPSGPLGAVISPLFDLPHIVSIHGGDIYDPTKRLSPHNSRVLRTVVTRVLDSADSVVAQSMDTRQRAIEHYGVSESNVRIVPHPYEPVEFTSVPPQELGLDPETQYIVSIGRLVERKGYETLLRAVQRLDDTELLLIGDGPLSKRLTELAESLSITRRVHMLGYVEEARKFQYLDNASVYALSSLHEGFGIVLQEAMQVGLPIVATDVGGQTDIIKDGVHGRLVSPSDPAQLADAVTDVLSTGPETYAARNRERAERYRPERVAEEYLSIFRDL